MIKWRVSSAPVPYEEAVSFMEARARAIREGAEPEMVWLLEHPPIYTAGSGAKENDLLEARFPVHQTGRGGQITYHGPGQRVAYCMVDLTRIFAPAPPDLRRYIQRLEAWIIAALAKFGIEGFTREGRVGVWVMEGKEEKKIAAVGVRVKRWVAYHGIAINVNPDLSHYGGIVPCGIRGYGVTSMQALGISAAMSEVDAALKKNAYSVLSSAYSVKKPSTEYAPPSTR